jgi:hypothetical protein
MSIILSGDIVEAIRGNSRDSSFLGHKWIYERKHFLELFSNTGNAYGIPRIMQNQ